MLMLCNSSEHIEEEITYIEMLKRSRVEALILLTNNNIEPYLEKGFPIVSFDRRFEGVPFVASDNYRGGVLVAQHLLKKECRNFMFISDDAQGEHSVVNTEVAKRRIGFVEELMHHGIDNIINIEYPLGDYKSIPESVYQAVIDHPEVDGIFTSNDIIVAEVARRLEKVGRNVPNDVKIIGFDGGRETANLGKTITSISQSPQRIARALVENVLLLINGEKGRDIILPIEFIQGETA